ncbi:hypothetical protein RRG08_057987 [Elysia crispata]|uniref:Uncharacterized protein n=1 Tax=Elysia crispata TaxID=231223 RepID=A0AAE1AG93_9GAST|nr:hypothetical protein RRG08_057987 [Elysia crispata]
MSVPSAVNIQGGLSYLPGVSYLPDKIEVEIDDPIVTRVVTEFLDFLKYLTDLMKLMHIIKTKQLRSMTPIPTPVLREIMVLDNMGPRYKAWDRGCAGAIPGLSNSADNLFRIGMSSSLNSARHTKPVYRKEQQQKKRKGGLDVDLIEITGKKTKPLWHSIALETTPLKLGPINTMKGRATVPESFGLSNLLLKKNRPVDRSNSEQLLINIKAACAANVKASNPTFQNQMDMLLARDAGFKTVEDHKAYLDTQKPHWYKDLLMEAYKMGILYSQEVVQAFEALGRYYETTSTSMAYPKSKLCFLVLSLPVWDVCQIAFQRALDVSMDVCQIAFQRALDVSMDVCQIAFQRALDVSMDVCQIAFQRALDVSMDVCQIAFQRALDVSMDVCQIAFQRALDVSMDVCQIAFQRALDVSMDVCQIAFQRALDISMDVCQIAFQRALDVSMDVCQIAFQRALDVSMDVCQIAFQRALDVSMEVCQIAFQRALDVSMDVCQIAFQRALDYYLHAVLKIPAESNCLAEWLRCRKLPYLVRQPVSSEMQFLNKPGVPLEEEESLTSQPET